jgi:hypothetical protein
MDAWDIVHSALAPSYQAAYNKSIAFNNADSNASVDPASIRKYYDERANMVPGGGEGKLYNTLDDAAEAAVQELGYKDNIKNQEYMTILVKDRDSGKYYRLPFHTSGQRDRVDTNFDTYGIPTASVHNHPVPLKSDPLTTKAFSNTDVTDVQHNKLDKGYLSAQMPKGNSYDLYYDPKTMPRERAHMADIHSAAQAVDGIGSYGDRMLGGEFPIDEFKQHLAKHIRDMDNLDPDMKKRFISRLLVPDLDRSNLTEFGTSAPIPGSTQ